MSVLQWILLFGCPGLLLGLAVGAIVHRWKVLVVAGLIGAVAVGFGLAQVPDDGPDDDDPIVLVYIVAATNLGGWVVGLGVGAGTARIRRGS